MHLWEYIKNIFECSYVLRFVEDSVVSSRRIVNTLGKQLLGTYKFFVLNDHDHCLSLNLLKLNLLLGISLISLYTDLYEEEKSDIVLQIV